MRSLLLGLLLVAGFVLPAQTYDTVYINPDYTGTKNGTYSHPFNSWDEIYLQDNTVYLQKRGTTAQGGISILNKNYVKIGAYGEGTNPILTNVPGTEANIIGFSRSKYCEIMDLNLIGSYPVSPTAGIQITGHWSSGTSNDIIIKNCEISYCYNGIRIIPGSTDVETVTIEGCEIHHINEDGIFAKDINNFSCINTHIYKVNLDWHYQCHDHTCASGDGIQLTGDCDNFLVDNCIIDRRYTGLKFCFIHNSDDGGYGNDGIIRDCTFYPPKDTLGAPSAGGALFLFDGDTLIIERTKIIGSDRLYSNDAGAAGQLSFDYIFMNYVLGDSVSSLQVSMKNDICYVNNTTFTSNSPDNLILDLGGGIAIVKNTVIAAGPNTTPYYDINEMDSCIIYQGPSSNWQNVFGWVDWGNGDYHLLADSPLIDQGINTGISMDLDKNPVPQGAGTDIGTYEYQEGIGSIMPPIPDFQSSNTNILAGETVTFYDNSINNPTSWLWVVQGATPLISSEQNPTFTFPNAGQFDVTMFATNDAGNNYITKSNFITVAGDGSETIQLKAFLEGPFMNSEMINDLNKQDLIPLDQPYAANPWFYNGAESVASLPNNEVIDWIMIEFRETIGGPETATHNKMIDLQAGFILSDGSIVDLDGSSLIKIYQEITSNLYVVLWHRNHMELMSAYPLAKSNGIYTYDFTTSAEKTFGGELVTTEVSPGIWASIAGDGNRDNQINNIDKNLIWLSKSGSVGYFYGDYNLDGLVNLQDLIDFWGKNAGAAQASP